MSVSEALTVGDPSQSPQSDHAPRPSAKRHDRTTKQKRRLALNILLQAFAMIGIALLVYPDAASWFARFGHNAEISGYVESVAQTPSAERQAILAAAYTYNEQLKPGPLVDPYVSQAEDEALRSDVYLAYEELLRISGSETIGTLSYPQINVGLPVYHGTADTTISKGIGHMYGTSLPVGGPSTRSVLTSHSGLPQSALLTDLHKAKIDDTFWISVLGEEHYYRVVEIETVLPGETESLKIIEGEDWVTLFTCTPIGINSHRLMVHATRIPSPVDDSGRYVIPGDGLPAGFPWWPVAFVAGSGAVGWILFAPPRTKRKKLK